MNKKSKQINKQMQKQKNEEMTLQNIRVLYFDDEPFISGSLAETLKVLGWSVTLVSEVDELFKCLNNDHYSILILDIMAPIPQKNNKYVIFSKNEIDEMNGGMNTGIVFSKKIWNLPNYQNLPILFMTARNAITITDLPKDKKYSFIRKPELALVVSEQLQSLLK